MRGRPDQRVSPRICSSPRLCVYAFIGRTSRFGIITPQDHWQREEIEGLMDYLGIHLNKNPKRKLKDRLRSLDGGVPEEPSLVQPLLSLGAAGHS